MYVHDTKVHPRVYNQNLACDVVLVGDDDDLAVVVVVAMLQQ